MPRTKKQTELPLRLQNERRRTLRWWARAGYSLQDIVDSFEGLSRYKVKEILREDADKHPYLGTPEL